MHMYVFVCVCLRNVCVHACLLGRRVYIYVCVSKFHYAITMLFETQYGSYVGKYELHISGSVKYKYGDNSRAVVVTKHNYLPL